MRQGDFAHSYVSQLRVDDDRKGPGPDDLEGWKVPYLGEWADHDLVVGDQKIKVRVWSTWVAIVAQTCELDNQVADDSRVLVAPVAFGSLWDKGQWSDLRSNRAFGYFYLPPMSSEDREKLKARGWPADTESAIVFGNTTVISRQLVGPPVFGVDARIRGLLQEKLTLFWTVRDWKQDARASELEGMTIVKVDQTREIHREKGILHKVHLSNGRDDEASVGIVFKP